MLEEGNMQKLTRRELLKFAGFSAAGLALAACTPAQPGGAAPQGQSQGQAPAKAPIRITMVESWFGIPQFKESIDPITQAISKKMQSEGTNIEIVSLILDEHDTKYPALYAAGADFTMAFDAPWYKMDTLRVQGALLAIEDLVDANGAQLKQEITDKIYQANFIDNHLWGVPAAYYYNGTKGVIYREDLRKKYGVPMPTSEEGWPSLEPFLQAIQKNEPNVLPFVNIPTQSLAQYTRGLRPWAPGVPQTGVQIPDVTKDFKLADYEDINYVVEIAQLLRTWWEKGYVNKTDMPSSGSSQNAQIDFVYPGKAMSCVENEPEFKWVDQTKQIKASLPDAELMGVDMSGMRAGKEKPLGALKQWNFIVFNASAPKEQQTAGIQYFNWLASSQDNMDLWLMGIDGVNYKKEDNLRFSEIDGVDQARNYRRQWYVSGLSGRFQRLPADLPQVALDALTFFTTESNWVFNPYEQFAPDTKALEVDSAKLNAVYLEAVHGLMSGQVATDEAVKQTKQMLDDAGRQTYKEKLQKQLDDYIAAHKA